jgi:hypothetical protein
MIRLITAMTIARLAVRRHSCAVEVSDFGRPDQNARCLVEVAAHRE